MNNEIFKYPIGTLIRAKNTLSFEKFGVCIVLKHSYAKEESRFHIYTVFSQQTLCERTFLVSVIDKYFEEAR